MKRLLPENWLYVVGDDGSHQFLTLHGMISQGAKFNNYFQTSLPFSNLDLYRERILNPFSHDDLKTPLYRGELILLLKDIEALERVRKKDIIMPYAIGKDSYHFEVETSSGILSADFIFLERFSVVTYDNAEYYSNSEIKVTFCTLPSWKNRIGRLRRFLKDLSSRAKINFEDSYDCITDPRLNISLRDLY